MDCGITVQQRGDRVYYSVTWSALRQADRWQIASSVPAVGGVYEIYWMDEHKHLRMLTIGNAAFGGLRSEIRRFTDPELVDDPEAIAILNDKEIWFRYAPTDRKLIGTVISGFLRVCVENRLLPRTTTVYPARTTDPTRFFGNADNR